MLRGAEMAGGVLVLRIVAAADVAAGHADAQVDPGVAAFQAFFAAIGIARARLKRRWLHSRCWR